MEARKLSIFLANLAALFLACLAGPLPMPARSVTTKNPLLELDRFSSSVQALAARVSPSVVQVLVARYGPQEESNGSAAVVTRQQALGSGVIVDPDGYIMTNAHVVEGAQQIRLRLVSKGGPNISSVLSESYAPAQRARLVGVFKEGDLALLKIDATNLPALPFANYSKLRQGQVVFAFGSPEDLQNSVSMGVVSSIARQLDPDSPLVYLQTDAPINPGESGGPLVTTAGEIVGLNSFVVSDSGGNEGIGFAIPSTMVRWAYQQLRQYGHVHRPVIGIGLQTITPTLAAALNLPRTSGVLVSDVLPGSPAESAGLRMNDILLAVDGIPLNNVAAMMRVTFEYHDGQPLDLRVLRGGDDLCLRVVPIEAPDPADTLADLADPPKSVIPKLGILGITVDKRMVAITGNLRRNSGVIVAARVQDPVAVPDTGLETGDVIHDLNGIPIRTVEGLRVAVAEIKPGEPVALFIERDGKLSYISFEME
jgi:serine protease Do